jgi:hypothetical protein
MVSIYRLCIDSQNGKERHVCFYGIGSCSDITSIKTGIRSISKWLIQLEQEY